MKLTPRHLLSSFALFLFSVVASGVEAHQVSFLIGPQQPTAAGQASYNTIRFSIYLDPLKTNWVALSRTPLATPYMGSTTVHADGETVVSVIDPWGHRSQTLNFGQFDENGVPTGQQSLIYGKAGLTPPVLRTDPKGNPLLVTENGVIDDFVNGSGEGYYTFSITYSNSDPTATKGPLYLLMDVVEGFRQKPPIQFFRQPGMVEWTGNNDGGNDGSNGFFATGGEPGGGGGGGHDHNNNGPHRTPDREFPPPPIPGGEEPGGGPPEPNVPEPGTIMLVGLGLVGAAILARRRIVEQA